MRNTTPRQRQRGSILSRLHGYEAMEEGDTVESLQAEFLELTGEPYRTREQEAADQGVAVEVRGKERKAEARKGLTGHRLPLPRARGSGIATKYSTSWGFLRLTPAASGGPSYRLRPGTSWKRGLRPTVIVEDGYTDVPKAERWGCWAGELVEVINYVNAKEAKRELRRNGRYAHDWR